MEEKVKKQKVLATAILHVIVNVYFVTGLRLTYRDTQF